MTAYPYKVVVSPKGKVKKTGTGPAAENGGALIGVMPEKLADMGFANPKDCKEFYVTTGMRERKAKMDEISDAVDDSFLSEDHLAVFSAALPLLSDLFGLCVHRYPAVWCD